MCVPATMPDREYRRRPLHPGLQRSTTTPGGAASGTRDRRLQEAVRPAVGGGVDQQRPEEPTGLGQACGTRPGERLSCGLAQVGRLERAASRSLDEAPRLGSRAGGQGAETEGVCVLWSMFFCPWETG